MLDLLYNVKFIDHMIYSTNVTFVLLYFQKAVIELCGFVLTTSFDTLGILITIET